MRHLMRSQIHLLHYCTLALLLKDLVRADAVSVGFSEHPQDVVALPGDSVYFSCKLSSDGADHDSIRWLHNGSLIPVDDAAFVIGRNQLSIRLGSDHVLVSRQLGTYQCLGRANGISIASLSATLSIAELGNFSVQRPQTIEALIGNDVLVECALPPSNPPPFVQFYKDGVLQAPGGNASNAQVINGDMLLIHDVRAENAGNYTCSASNHISNQRRMSPAPTVLSVRQPAAFEKPQLTFRPRDQYTVEAGRSVVLPCVASGQPKPEIVWTRLGGSSGERLPSEHGCLEIDSAQESDGGGYMCAIFSGSRRFLRRTSLVVTSPPVFTRAPPLLPNVLEQGLSLWLHCQAAGTPQPAVSWFFNGLPVAQQTSKLVLENGTLYVPSLKKTDEGVYQCFIENSVGQNVTNVWLRINGSSSDGSEDESSWLNSEVLKSLTTVSPSKPNVTQNSRTSAMLKWDVPKAGAPGVMPIQFFKVQYREFHKQKRSDWLTVDDVIAASERSFEVVGLKMHVAYRFRMVAVFENDDNMHGPLSARFRLNPSFHHSLGEAPLDVPTITEVLPLSETSLRVGWRMDVVSKALIEGYFIYIRPVGKQRHFDKVTIIGHASHSFIFEQLQRGQSYDVKVEAFNFAGSSPSSAVSRRSTLPGSFTVTEARNVSDRVQTTAAPPDRGQVYVPEERLTMYLVVAGILVGVVVMMIVCCSVASCMRKRRIRKDVGGENAAIHEKYLDTAHSINLSHNYHVSSITIGSTCPSLHGDVFSSSQSNHTAETSFSSPNHGHVPTSASRQHMSLEVVSSNPQAMEDEADSLSSGRESGVSLGFEEYTDEPSRGAWKRSTRRSTQFL